jgi:hypothetical protein
MAKARHVGTPHSLQLVLGNNLKIWIPVNAMVFAPLTNSITAMHWSDRHCERNPAPDAAQGEAKQSQRIALSVATTSSQ